MKDSLELHGVCPVCPSVPHHPHPPAAVLLKRQVGRVGGGGGVGGGRRTKIVVVQKYSALVAARWPSGKGTRQLLVEVTVRVFDVTMMRRRRIVIIIGLHLTAPTLRLRAVQYKKLEKNVHTGYV